MRRLLLALLAAFTVRSTLAQATEPPTFTMTPSPTLTPSPTRTPSMTPTLFPTLAPTATGFAVEGWTEIVFPEAIQFTIRLARPAAQLESARLTLHTATDDETFELDIQAAAVRTDPEADLVYLWEFTPDSIPPLFTTLEYEWEVAATDRETARLNGALFFTDPRVIWDVTQAFDGDLEIALARGLPTSLVSSAQSVYNLLTHNTERSPGIRLILYPDSVAPGCDTQTLPDGTSETLAISPLFGTTVACDPAFAAQVYEASGYVPFQRRIDSEEDIITYLVSAFYQPRWQGGDVPEWFASGLALLYTPSLKTDLLPIAQAQARNNRLFPLDIMNRAPESVGARSAWRVQAYAMMLYTAEHIGLPGIFHLADSLGRGVSFADAYQQATRQPLDSLLPGLQQWVFTDRAAAAFGITPYQPATLTFTPTFTATATRTPTATPSYTPSLIPSVTGALSPTPYPTVTSSHTPSPAPPTNTPRLPGPTAMPPSTASPSSPAAAASWTTTQLTIVALLLVVIGILVYVYIRLGRR